MDLLPLIKQAPSNELWSEVESTVDAVQAWAGPSQDPLVAFPFFDAFGAVDSAS